jgi:hypothetical protein
MAQGAGKIKGKAKESGGRKKTGTMRKGRIAIPPKQAQKVREHSHKKVGLTRTVSSGRRYLQDSNYQARSMNRSKSRWYKPLHLVN